MTKIKTVETAFCKYLLSQPLPSAVQHVIECLTKGDSSNNMAWDLMEEYAGEDWSCKPEDLPNLIADCLLKMEQEHHGHR